MRSSVSLVIITLGAASMFACSPAKPVAAAQPAFVESTPTAVATPALKLPVSLNAVMVSLVDHASEPLWLDAYDPPSTQVRWREAEYNAYQMAVSGKLIQLPGAGPNDADWVSDPEWKTFADEMSAAGMDALQAAQIKNVQALNDAGDRLVASCESCHKKFKPGLTSMGLYKSTSYPPSK